MACQTNTRLGRGEKGGSTLNGTNTCRVGSHRSRALACGFQVTPTQHLPPSHLHTIGLLTDEAEVED